MYHMVTQFRTWFLCIAILVAALLPSLAAASELVMFERRGCIWCARWDREVAPGYDNSDEARRLPLRRVDLDRSRTGNVALKEPVIYTPTFVVADDSGREVGRITGFIDNASFWGLLGTLIAKLSSPLRATDSAQQDASAGRT